MGIADYAHCLLLIVAWREARGDGRDAMRAVAHVIKNRADQWGGDLIHQITNKNQFSSMSVLGDSQTIVWPNEADVVNLAALIDNIVSGVDSDNTSGALYYANEVNVTSGWYKENIMTDSHPVCAIVGQQTFRK